MKKTFRSLFLLGGLCALAVIPLGCAHARVKSATLHKVEEFGVVAPPGWTVVKASLTNSATANTLDNFSVVAPAGTNAAGFFAPRPKIFLAFRETWSDTSSGGGTFVFTDPSASQLGFAHTNQSALGGGRSTTIGTIQSTVTTNDVAAVTAVGSAAGNVIGAAAKAAAGKP